MKKSIVAALFILIIFQLSSAGLTGSAVEASTVKAPYNLVIDGRNDSNEWRGYPVLKTFNEDNVINTGMISAAKVNSNTVKLHIYGEFKKSGGAPENPGLIFRYKGNSGGEIFVSQGQYFDRNTKKLITLEKSQICEITAAQSYEDNGSYTCEIEITDHEGLGDSFDIGFEFRAAPPAEGESLNFPGKNTINISVKPSQAVASSAQTRNPEKNSSKATTSKADKTTSAKSTAGKSTTAKSEKSSAVSQVSSQTAQISHRTRPSTAAKRLAEKKTTQASTANTATVKPVKTAAPKTVKEAPAATRRIAGSAAAPETVSVSEQTATTAETSGKSSSETLTQPQSGALSKATVYKIIIAACALVIFGVIGVFAVSAKAQADKAQAPETQKQDENGKEK